MRGKHAHSAVSSCACGARSFQVLNQRYDIVFYYFSNITTVPGSKGQVGWCAPKCLNLKG